MRQLVLSDVHADPAALDRVLTHAAGEWDRLFLLGDLVGYGPDAAAVVGRLRELEPAALVRGNHEEMMLAILDGRDPRAAPGIARRLQEHAASLSHDELSWLASAPLRHLEGTDEPGDPRGFELVHGSPDPARPFDYLLSVPAARSAAPHARRDLTFVGHSHVPGGFLLRGGRWQPIPARRAEARVVLERGERAFLNPGSVSLPRDGGPAGCYLLWDDESRTATLRRLGP